MAVNVAELVATISLRVEGMNSAVQQVRTAETALTNALQAIEDSATSTSAQTQKLRQDVAELSNSLISAAGAPQRLAQELNALGTSADEIPAAMAKSKASISTLGSELKVAQANTQAMRATLDQFLSTMSDANRAMFMNTANYKKLAAGIAEAEAAEKKIIATIAQEEARLKRLAAAQRDADRVRSGQTQRDTVNLTAKLETATGRLTGAIRRQTEAARPAATAQRSMADMFRLSNEQMGSFFLQMAQGNISMGAFTSVIGRIIMMLPALAAGIAVVAAALSPLVIGFKLAKSELGALGQQMERQSLFAPMTAELVALQQQLGLTQSGVQSFFEKAKNQGASLGINDSAGFANAQGQAAASLRFLSSDRDPTRALEAVQQAVKGSLDPLKSYGINVEAIENQLANLPSTASEGERAIVALNAATAAIAANQGKAREAAGATSATFKELTVTMDQIKDALAARLAPATAQAIVAIADFGRKLAPVIAGVIVLLQLFATAAVKAFEFVMNAGGKLSDFFEKWGRYLPGRIGAIGTALGQLFDAPALGVDDLTRDIEGFFDSMGGAIGDLGKFESGVDGVVRSLSEMRSQISGGFSVVDTVKQFGDALNAIDKDGLSPRTAFDLAKAMDSQFNAALDGGLERVQLLQAELHRMRQGGFISTEEFDAVRSILEDTAESMRPFEAAAQNVRDQISGVGQVGAAAESTVRGVETALDALDGKQVTATINIVTNGSMGTFGVPTYGGGGGGFSTARLGSKNSGKAGDAIGGVSRPDRSGQEEAGRYAAMGRAFDNARSAAQNVANALATPGGGGGGGGGASVGDIRKFFREMNKLIKIGVNGGVSFSTAGNTMPLGGRGDFLNRSGGTLIETVNIRGIWDFTDPGQKKQIIRELEQALRNLKRGQN